MNEEWKDIPRYEGFYKISNHGRVKSSDRRVNARGGRTALRKGQILKHNLSGPKRDYPCICLCVNKQKKTIKIHRLVALVFIGDPNGLTVDHIDGNKLNNRVDNLRYCTIRENCTHYTSSLDAKRPYTGVSKEPRCKNRWRACISINGKMNYIGFYNTPEAARDAYLAKKESIE